MGQLGTRDVTVGPMSRQLQVARLLSKSPPVELTLNSGEGPRIGKPTHHPAPAAEASTGSAKRPQMADLPWGKACLR